MTIEVGNGGGGVFVSEGIISGVVSSGATGNFIVAPEVDSKKYKLFLLVPDSNLSGITLSVDDVDIVSNGTLAKEGNVILTSDRFFVSRLCSTGTGTAQGLKTVFKEIMCNTFTVSTSGTTNTEVFFAYEVGSIK